MGVSGKVVTEPVWHPYSPQSGEMLNVSFSFSELIWPWSGYLAVHVIVNEAGAAFDGIAQGHVSLTVESPMEKGELLRRTVGGKHVW